MSMTRRAATFGFGFLFLMSYFSYEEEEAIVLEFRSQ